MKENKARTILLASSMIMLSTAVIVGGTYALWSDRVSVNHHLSAGTLKVELTRTYLEKYGLGDDMYMNRIIDNKETDTFKNVFDIKDDELIVPTSYYATKLKLTNVGDVAIDYTINVTVDKDSDLELAKQVIIHIGDNQIATYDENNGYSMNENNDECNYLAKKTDSGNVDYLTYEAGKGSMDINQKEKEFWVEIMFENLANSDEQNKSQGKSIKFDLLIDATQKISK